MPDLPRVFASNSRSSRRMQFGRITSFVWIATTSTAIPSRTGALRWEPLITTHPIVDLSLPGKEVHLLRRLLNSSQASELPVRTPSLRGFYYEYENPVVVLARLQRFSVLRIDPLHGLR